MKYLGILIFESLFFCLVFLRKAREDISCSFFLTIINLKKVLKKFLGPLDLTSSWTLYIHKLIGVDLINKDENFKFIVFQVVVLSIRGFNNSKEFLIVNLISSLGRDNFLKKKDYWVLFASFELRKKWIFVDYVIESYLVRNHLTKASINRIPQYISFNTNMVF